MVNRKRLLHLSAASAAGLMLPNLLFGQESNLTTPAEHVNSRLADAALNTARTNGADYADVRIVSSKLTGARQAGIRTIVGGYWGYAYTSNMTEQGIQHCVEQAMANAVLYKSTKKRHQYNLKVRHDLWRCAFLK